MHGEVINTHDVKTFQGLTVEEVRQAFRDSVDDYLAFCAERGEKPEKPFSGTFAVRLRPELHRLAHLAAQMQDQSLNPWVSGLIESSTVSLRESLGETCGTSSSTPETATKMKSLSYPR